jgi:hypothetical protein
VTALTVKLNLDAVGDNEALRFSRDLRRDIESLDGVEVVDSPAAGVAGARGELSMIGAFALAVMSHEVMPMLVQLLKGYIARDDRVTIDLTLPNGKTISINSSPSAAEQLKGLLAELGP